MRVRPTGNENVIQGGPHGVDVLAVVDGIGVRKGGLLHQTVGAGPVEAYPVIFPGVGRVGTIDDQLVRLDEKQIARNKIIRFTAHFVTALSGHHQMDQVMVTNARAPGMAGNAALLPAVKDGKLHIVCVVLLKGLLIDICHPNHSRFFTNFIPLFFHYSRQLNKSPCQSAKTVFTSSKNLI